MRVNIDMRIITGIAAFAVAAGSLGAQTPEAVMDRAVRKYESMKTMRAEFRQTITNPLTGSTSVSRGELLRRQPNLLAINFSDPKATASLPTARQCGYICRAAPPARSCVLPPTARPREISIRGLSFSLRRADATA